MDIIREKRSYKHFRNESSKICKFNFHSLVPNCKNNSYKNGQHCCPFLFCENGGTQNQLLIQISKEIWKYLLDKGVTITA